MFPRSGQGVRLGRWCFSRAVWLLLCLVFSFILFQAVICNHCLYTFLWCMFFFNCVQAYLDLRGSLFRIFYPKLCLFTCYLSTFFAFVAYSLHRYSVAVFLNLQCGTNEKWSCHLPHPSSPQLPSVSCSWSFFYYFSLALVSLAFSFSLCAVGLTAAHFTSH